MSEQWKLVPVEPTDDVINRIANALEVADFGWSITLTGLVDGVETWTLRYPDTGEVFKFDERDEASRHLAHRKKEIQADAVIRALAAAPAPAGEQAATAGPYEARRCAGMMAGVCDYGVVSLSAGREVCRVWEEQDARAIASLLNAHPAPSARDEALEEAAKLAEQFEKCAYDGVIGGRSIRAEKQALMRDVAAAIRSLKGGGNG